MASVWVCKHRHWTLICKAVNMCLDVTLMNLLHPTLLKIHISKASQTVALLPCLSSRALGIFLIIVTFGITSLQWSQLQTISKETSLGQNMMQINTYYKVQVLNKTASDSRSSVQPLWAESTEAILSNNTTLSSLKWWCAGIQCRAQGMKACLGVIWSVPLVFQTN